MDTFRLSYIARFSYASVSPITPIKPNAHLYPTFMISRDPILINHYLHTVDNDLVHSSLQATTIMCPLGIFDATLINYSSSLDDLYVSNAL